MIKKYPLVEGVDREDSRARDLLMLDTDLRDVVSEGVFQLKRAFGGAEVHIDYLIDHEDEEPDPCVIVTVFPDMPFDDAHEIMDEVEDRWVLDNMNRAGGRFSFEVHPLQHK